MSNLSPNGNHEYGILNSRNYARDHRDQIIYKKVPKGYKIIGIRAKNNTINDQVLHFTDFIIWKPPQDWLKPTGKPVGNLINIQNHLGAFNRSTIKKRNKLCDPKTPTPNKR